MTKAIIIQQIYHGSDYDKIIAMTLPRTLQACKRHGLDYHFVYGNVMDEWEQKYGGWAKLPLILSAFSNDYQHVIWLDADAMIADLDTDPRGGCPESGLGMTINTQPFPHFNVGMIYATKSDEVVDFIQNWITWFPGPVKGWHEQAMLNLLIHAPHFGNIVKQIDNKWNSCTAGGTHVDKAVVEAFHGEGAPARRYELMKDFLQKVTYA